MGELKAVILDFNGTLVNDHKIAWKVVTRIFKHFGIESPTLQQFRYEFHFPYWTIFTNRGLSDKQAKCDCRKLYARFYEEELGNVQLFQDVTRCLSELKDSGYRLGLVSQSHRLLLECLVRKFEISHFFESIISLDDCSEQKPSPLPLLMCAERIGIQPKECIYFGDMVEDQHAAYNARMFKGAVASKGSYHSIHALENTNPHILVSSLREIPEEITKFENSLVKIC